MSVAETVVVAVTGEMMVVVVVVAQTESVWVVTEINLTVVVVTVVVTGRLRKDYSGRRKRDDRSVG